MSSSGTNSNNKGDDSIYWTCPVALLSTLHIPAGSVLTALRQGLTVPLFRDDKAEAERVQAVYPGLRHLEACALDHVVAPVGTCRGGDQNAAGSNGEESGGRCRRGR